MMDYHRSMLQLARKNKHAADHIKIAPEDLGQGLLIVGQTGMGQNQLLKSLMAQDVQMGQPTGVLDATGHFIPEVAGFVPSRSINDAALLDFADTEFPVSYNPLATVSSADRVAAKDAFLTSLQAIFGNSWGPRMEYILANASMATIEHDSGTLLTLHELLVDATVRRRVLGNVTDPFVRQFFANEFDQWDDRFRREAIAPIQNKVGQFLLDPSLRNLVCQTQNAVPDLGTATALLAKAPRRSLGETAGRLLGLSLLTNWLQSDAAATVYVPSLHRLDAPGLPALIEQSTEGNLGLVASVPSLSTLSDDLREALLAHMGHLVVFRCGADDAELLCKLLDRFNPDRALHDVMSLDPGQLLVRHREAAVAKQYTPGFVPELPSGWSQDVIEKVVDQSRDRYAVPRQQIESKLARHMEASIE